MSDTIRLDKWLWCARFYKTRSLANKAIVQGKITYNGQKINPSQSVRTGSVLSIKTALYEKTIIIKGITLQRQSAPMAQALYEETSESLLKKEAALVQQREQKWLAVSAPCPMTKPDKHSRQKMRKLKRKYENDL